MSLGTLPSGWRWARVEDVGTVQLGRQRSPKYHDGPNMRPYLRVANVFEDRIDASDLKWMDFAPDEFERYKLLPGDILLNEGQTPELLGRPAIYRGVPDEVAFTNSLIRFRARPDVNPRWALLVFRRHMHFGRFTRESRITTNIAHLSASRFKTVEFPVPPLGEQRRIVDTLEDHLSRLDQGTHLLRRLRQQLSAVRQSSLDWAMAAAEADPQVRVVRIADIARVGSGATPLKSRSDYYLDGTIPWVTSGELSHPLILEPKQYITELALRETSVRIWPPGTLLVAMYGEGRTRGRVAELTFESATNQACAAIVLHDESEVLRRWVALALEANYWNLRSIASGGVQPNLSLGLVKAIKIPVPPEPLRDTLLSTTNAVAEGEKRLGQALRKAEDREATLRRSLLDAAFSGRLTQASGTGDKKELAGV